jgi:cytidylate kinase
VIIAIDGPAGAGKSSVARALAQRLGFTYLDTGATYRAVALAAHERGIPAARAAREMAITFDGDRVLVDGADVSDAIRTPEVSELASKAAADAEVRASLVDLQRAIMAAGDWVGEGRDVGTVVAPDAGLKIFLTASAQERARRRAEQIGADPATVLAEQQIRDSRDAAREHSPLRPADDAVEVDTTGLSLDEVVERIAAVAAQRR